MKVLHINVTDFDTGLALSRLDIPNTLEALQAKVGGLIEVAFRHKNLIAYCNEEGLLLDLPIRFLIQHEGFVAPIAGNLIIVGDDGRAGS